MQRRLHFTKQSREEDIKAAGLVLDFDEIARRGTMTPDEIFVGKWYGFYNMRQPGSFMARVVAPGGVLTSAQARTLARLAEEYGQGKVSVTTRQAVQFHWLKCTRMADFLRDLRQGGLSSFHGAGDVNRNVAACARAESCPHARFDVLPHARAAHLGFVQDRGLDNLPRKHKISFSGCVAGCGQPRLNDIGLVALGRARGAVLEEGFQVYMGGGHGWHKAVAPLLFGFVPAELSTAVCLAIGGLFRDHGDRWDRSTSRLKFVVSRRGLSWCRDEVLADLQARGHSRERFEVAKVEDAYPAPPPRPLTTELLAADGSRYVTVVVPRGEMTFHQFRRLAELSEMHGDKRLRLTNRQNVELHGVRPDAKAALELALGEAGFRIGGAYGLRDPVTCVGTTYCPLAITRTHVLHDQIASLVWDPRYDGAASGVLVNITGCPNSCSPYGIADLGFRGTRLRTTLGSEEGYEVRIGGTEERHGDRLGDFSTEDCLAVTEAVLDTFVAAREGQESLAEQVLRRGLTPFQDAVAGLALVREVAPFQAEHSAEEGLVAQPRDFRVYAKDVPCRHACPAATRVPQYISLLVQGYAGAAYRMNQEDNVFPGVLGRICSRPCEAACRHQLGGTEGPVQICHLKRLAADGRSQAAGPLTPWFPEGTKRVAIVGSGPAGLAAARELRRYGHAVRLLEAEAVLGGMMRLCIPSFRLPREVLEAEIQAIVDQGVEVELERWVSAEDLQGLLLDHDAVVLAAGAIQATPLDLPGLPAADLRLGIHFMKVFNLGRVDELRAPVVVVGGGYTAVDCARAARRMLGPEGGDVTLAYRRTEAQMPASAAELEELRREDIRVETLVAPRDVRLGAQGRNEGRLEALVMQRYRLEDVPASGGKPAIHALPERELELPCATLVVAVGQRRVHSLLPRGVTAEGITTSQPGLFVAGDFSSGSLDVIHAVASGRAAADAIDEFLMGHRRRHRVLRRERVSEGWTGRLRDMDLMPPPEMATLSPLARGIHDEVELGYGSEEGLHNARRCFLCHHKYEIDQDRCIHCEWCLKVAPRDCIRRVRRIFHDEDGVVADFVETDLPQDATYIWIDSDQCIRCGACLRICPVGAISCHRTIPETVAGQPLG